jgi:Tfp pilus assembly protein FimT
MATLATSRRDRDESPRRSRLFGRRQAGFSTLEMLAAIAVLGVAIRFGVPKLAGGSDLALYQAHEQLVADLRNTRADALIAGDHFQLEITANNKWNEYRMALQNDGKWKASNNATRSRKLPTGLAFTAGIGSQFEFNTRGLLVGANQTATLTLKDSRTNLTQSVSVWPSGQVQP